MELTLDHLRAYCIRQRTEFTMNADGSMWLAGRPLATAHLQATLGYGAPAAVEPQPVPSPMRVPGYEELATVLVRAFEQAAHGKGKERHAQGEPFTQQVMQDMARRFGVGALLGQAFKKSEESQRLPHDKAVAELLGAINYLAGAVIAMEGRQQAACVVKDADALHAAAVGMGIAPANDNTPPCCSNSAVKQNLARCAGCTESKTFGRA